MRISPRQTWTRAAAGLMVVAAVSPAWAVVSSLPGRDYILQDEGKNYPAVVQGWGFHTSLTEYKNKSGQTIGLTTFVSPTASGMFSADLIDSNYLITAGHCVRDAADNLGWFQFDIGGELYRAEQWWTPADYDYGGVIDGKDIAIVRLDRPVPTVAEDPQHGVDPMAYASLDGTPDYRYGQPDNSADQGIKFTMVGFGEHQLPFTEGGTAQQVLLAGVRRAAQNRYDISYQGGGLLDSDLTLNFDLDYEGEYSTPPDNAKDIPVENHDPEGIILPGDSGGASIYNGEIVGIHSTISTLGDKLVANDTEVSRFGKWIRALVDHHDEQQSLGAFGYQTGIAGISIQDILNDLAKPQPTLVPYLIENGFYNPLTGQGTSPFFGEFSYQTGKPNDFTGVAETIAGASGTHTVNFNPLSDEQVADAMAAIQQRYPNGVTVTDPAVAQALAIQAYKDFLISTGAFGPDGKGTMYVGKNAYSPGMPMTINDVIALNTALHPNMFGYTTADGTWVPGQYSGLVETPDLIPGDANGDGKVDGLDLQLIANNWQGTNDTWAQGDFNGDGKVDGLDLQLLANNWQAGMSGSAGQTFAQAAAQYRFGSPVPEPTSLALLALGGLGLLIRRRRTAA